MKIGLIITVDYIYDKDAFNFIKSMRSILQVIFWEDLIEWHISGIKYKDLAILNILFKTPWLRGSSLIIHPTNNETPNFSISRLEPYFKKIVVKEEKTAIECDNDIFRECSLFFLFSESLTDFKGRIQRFRNMLDKDISKYANLLSKGEEIEINITENNYILRQKKKIFRIRENEKEIQSNRISHIIEEDTYMENSSLEEIDEEEEEIDEEEETW